MTVYQSELIRAPAKLNLRLKVEGLRADGYHLLSMINVTCSLYDEVAICLTDSRELELAIDGTGDLSTNPAENLVSLAFLRFCECFGLNLGARIRLKKRIPICAGLGGGSSDAAAMLRYLSGRFAMEIAGRADEVNRIAQELGADVPFALRGGLARVTGVGERVEPLNGEWLDGKPCILVFSPESIPTARAFSLCRSTLQGSGPRTDEHGRRFGTEGPENWESLLSIAENDLERCVLGSYPMTAAALDKLRVNPSFVSCMTGSGSTLYCLPRSSSLEDAEQFARELTEQGLLCEVVRLEAGGR